MKISVLVPAYNEAKTIGSTLDSLAAALPRSEVVVIDDGDRWNRGCGRGQGSSGHQEPPQPGQATALARGCRSAREMSLPWWMPIWDPRPGKYCP